MVTLIKNRMSLNNKTVRQVKKSKSGLIQPPFKLAPLMLIVIMVLLNSFKEVSLAQLPDSPIYDLGGSNSLVPLDDPVASKLAILPVDFLQPKEPGDIFHISDALAERLNTAKYPTIIDGKIVLKRDPRPPKFNAKLAESIKALYNSLQIQIQPPLSAVD